MTNVLKIGLHGLLPLPFFIYSTLFTISGRKKQEIHMHTHIYTHWTSFDDEWSLLLRTPQQRLPTLSNGPDNPENRPTPRYIELTAVLLTPAFHTLAFLALLLLSYQSTAEKEHFPSRDCELLFMTLTFQLDFYSVKKMNNQHAKYLCQR